MSRTYKNEMCPNIIKYKQCNESYSQCKFAHHPNILNKTLPEKKLQLLKNNLENTLHNKIESRALTPFIPPKKGLYETSK